MYFLRTGSISRSYRAVSSWSRFISAMIGAAEAPPPCACAISLSMSSDVSLAPLSAVVCGSAIGLVLAAAAERRDEIGYRAAGLRVLLLVDADDLSQDVGRYARLPDAGVQ